MLSCGTELGLWNHQLLDTIQKYNKSKVWTRNGTMCKICRVAKRSLRRSLDTPNSSERYQNQYLPSALALSKRYTKEIEGKSNLLDLEGNMDHTGSLPHWTTKAHWPEAHWLHWLGRTGPNWLWYTDQNWATSDNLNLELAAELLVTLLNTPNAKTD